VILDEILARKRSEVTDARARCSESSLRERPLYAERRRGFAAALRDDSRRRIIAEIKKASPSRGVIRANFDPAEHARDYQDGGAACLSVLTDASYFQGGLADLEAARANCSIPLLRKDFVVDGYQIVEARAYGADAVLLIVAALTAAQLGEFSAVARAEGLDALVEVHDEAELETALAAGADLVGVNNRNLKTFETSTDVTRRLVSLVPDGVTLISESGLGAAEELAELESLGVAGFLIGETFMASEHPGRTLASLVGP
jgi:indole-3-glycerol phosphate synthase